MEIRGKVHLMFEQSGVFKNEFKKLGYEAYDYDIQNNFRETDYQIDLFKEIEDAYDGKPSLFDNIRGGQDGDLIMAFFPCIYFCGISQSNLSWESKNQKNLTPKKRMDKILERHKNRSYFYEILNKLCGVCLIRGIRMVLENPMEGQSFLRVFLKQPDIIDNNRMLRGDYMIKPTAYWFFNCEPMKGFFTEQNDKEKREPLKMKPGIRTGVCSEERSMISPDYARNFICDFILGRPQPEICPTLFDAM